MRSSRSMRSGSRVVVRLALALAMGAVSPPLSAGQTYSAGGQAIQGAGEFWVALGEPGLALLMEEAIATHPLSRAGASHVDGAVAARSAALYDLAPTLSVESGYNRQRLANLSPGGEGGAPRMGLWDAGLRLSWELDLSGRQRRLVSGRSAEIESYEASLRQVGVLLAAEVASAAYEVRALRERIEVASRNAENQRGTLGVTQRRLDAGQGTPLEVELAQAQLSATLSLLPSLDLRVRAAESRLAIAVGRPVQADGALDDAWAASLPTAISPIDQARVIDTRPDVQAAEWARAAERALVSSARAAYLPRVSIGASAGYLATELGAFGERGTPHYSAGPSLSWAIGDVGRVRAAIDQGRAREAAAAEEQRLTTLQATRDLEIAIAGYAAAREHLRHLDEAAAASERATEIARFRYEEGGTGFLEVLDAERRLLEAQERQVGGRAQIAEALVTLFRAAGGSPLLVGAIR